MSCIVEDSFKNTRGFSAPRVFLDILFYNHLNYDIMLVTSK